MEKKKDIFWCIWRNPRVLHFNASATVSSVLRAGSFSLNTTFPGDTGSRALQPRQGVAGFQGSSCLVMSFFFFFFKGSSRSGDLVFRSEYLSTAELLSWKLRQCLKQRDDFIVWGVLCTYWWCGENISRGQMGDMVLWADDRDSDCDFWRSSQNGDFQEEMLYSFLMQMQWRVSPCNSGH